MIQLINISKEYDNKKVVKDFTYEFKNRGFYFIVGKSGSGKTTLLNIIGGLALSIKSLLFVGIVAVVTIIIATQSDKIVRAMNDAFDNFVDLIRILRDSMLSLWDIFFKSSSTEVHHIVAKAAAAAEPARVRCRNLGIDVYNDLHNLVPIKYRLHRKLHTNACYSAVNSIIVPAHNNIL